MFLVENQQATSGMDGQMRPVLSPSQNGSVQIYRVDVSQVIGTVGDSSNFGAFHGWLVGISNGNNGLMAK